MGEDLHLCLQHLIPWGVGDGPAKGALKYKNRVSGAQWVQAFLLSGVQNEAGFILRMLFM